MVTERYLLDKPQPPSPAKRFVDQAVIPALIDAAAAVEQQVERIAVVTRRAPITSLCLAVGLGWLVSRVWRPLGSDRLPR